MVDIMRKSEYHMPRLLNKYYKAETSHNPRYLNYIKEKVDTKQVNGGVVQVEGTKANPEAEAHDHTWA